MNRRSFFSFLPLAPAVAGAAIISEAQAKETPVDGNRGTIQLRTAHGNVNMAVGRDGNLWLKTATGNWKRVVTE